MALTRAERWLRCPEKSCCSLLVYPTGEDIARIARSLKIAPWDFTTPVSVAAPSTDAFALDHSARRYRLGLIRTRTKKEPVPACTFLFRLRDGTARCGLGEGRPGACQTYPIIVQNGDARLDPAGCRCSWEGVILDERDADGLIAEHRARRRYGELVAAWNDRVARLEPSLDLNDRDFHNYLLESYP